MNKRFLKIMAVALSASLAFVATACGSTQVLDDGKTQLSVGVYDGGLGQDWTRAVADAFEEKYANTSFEEGKLGVQVTIYGKGQKANYEPSVLIPNIQNGIATNDVYYTANADVNKFVKAGVCADITDALSEKVYAEGGDLATTSESKQYSLLDKMDDYFVDSYKMDDGKYYAFPFEDSTLGIVYDADLFEERNWAVPETMDEFYTLLSKMVKANVTPLTWTGAYEFYYTPLTTSLVAQYEGIEGADMNLYYTGNYNGTEITARNAYLLAEQQGKLEALKFFRQITSNTNYYSNMAFGGSQGHLDAQNEYVLSVVRASNGGGKRIAMLIEGEWWENEARATFNEMGSTLEEYGYGKRNFKFLPMPTMEGQKLGEGKRVISSFSNGSVAFVNINSSQKEVAKLWIQFMHQNSSLATFTTYTGSVLPYEYTLTDEQYNGMTPFARSVWDLRHDENTYIYRVAKSHECRVYEALRMGGVGLEIMKNANTTSALREFWLDKDLTAEAYFQSSIEYYKNNWLSNYDKYYGV